MRVHAHFTGMHMRKVEMGRNGGAIYKAVFQIRNEKWKIEIENGSPLWASVRTCHLLARDQLTTYAEPIQVEEVI